MPELCPLPTYDCACRGTYCRLLGKDLAPKAVTERDTCAHEWVQHYSNRTWCMKCGASSGDPQR
jgi:hypothetical protein